MNNKNIAKIATWTSIAALAVGVAAIIIACPRKEELGFDYTGVIVGILSLLVTALIGWNIYKTLEIDRHIREKAEDAEHGATCITLAQLGKVLCEQEQPGYAIPALINALAVWKPKSTTIGDDGAENAERFLCEILRGKEIKIDNEYYESLKKIRKKPICGELKGIIDRQIYPNAK